MDRLVAFVVAALLAAGVTTTNAQHNAAHAEKLLASAQRKASIDGDLKGAIEEYKKAVTAAGSNRALAAQALLRMAECHQKLGDLEARRIYERVVRDYADQAESVSIARTRLGAIHDQSTPRPTLTVRQLWTERPNPTVVISPDGRFATFSDDGDLAIRDLATGTTRKVTRTREGMSREAIVQSSGRRVTISRMSPDGRRIAFGWATGKGYHELHVIGTDGTGEFVIDGGPDAQSFRAIDWTPDGTHVLATIQRLNREGQIAMVRLADRSVRVLKTMPWASLGVVALSPDGRYIGYDAATGRGDHRTIFVMTVQGTDVRPVIEGAARFDLFGWMPDGKHLLFASNERGGRELRAAPFVNGTVTGASRLVRSDIGTAEAVGITRAGAVVTRVYPTTGGVYTASVDWDTGAVSDVKNVGERLVGDGGPAWSPDGKQLTFVAHRGTDIFKRFVAFHSIETGDTRELHLGDGFNGVGTGWWSPDGTSLLVYGTHPIHGNGVYAADPKSGSVKLVVAQPGYQIQGAQWTNGGQSIIYVLSSNTTTSYRILVRDLATGSDRDITPTLARAKSMALGANISPDGQHVAFVAQPDSVIMVMPAAGGPPRELVRREGGQGNIWVHDWTPDSRRIVFHNANARMVSGIFSIAVEGGQPRRLALPAGALDANVQLTVHPDGKRIAYTVSRQEMEISIMENLAAAIDPPR